MNYKYLINNHFGSCVLLAKTRDEYRKRDVRVYALPGEFDYVGVADGTDAWVAPVVADPFSCNIKRILEDYRNGKAPVVSEAVVETAVPGARVRKQIKRPEAANQPVEKEVRIRRVISTGVQGTDRRVGG